MWLEKVQSYRLQGHGLAARIASGNDQPRALPVQVQIQGHQRVFQWLQLQDVPHACQQQGMTGFEEAQARSPQGGQRALALALPAKQGKGFVHISLEAVPALEIVPAGA